MGRTACSHLPPPLRHRRGQLRGGRRAQRRRARRADPRVRDRVAKSRAPQSSPSAVGALSQSGRGRAACCCCQRAASLRASRACHITCGFTTRGHRWLPRIRCKIGDGRLLTLTPTLTLMQQVQDRRRPPRLGGDGHRAGAGAARGQEGWVRPPCVDQAQPQLANRPNRAPLSGGRPAEAPHAIAALDLSSPRRVPRGGTERPPRLISFRTAGAT